MREAIGVAVGFVLVVMLLATGFLLGTFYEREPVLTPTAAPDEVQMTVQFVSGNGRAVRVMVLDAGSSGIDDLLGVFERPELFLEFDDERAVLFLPGDQGVVWCDRHGPEHLRFDNCEVLPVINRQY